jgi:shikimate dehydrogenase
VLPDDFDDVLPRLMRVRNLGGLVFTIPFKARAVRSPTSSATQARMLGVINALGARRTGAGAATSSTASAAWKRFAAAAFALAGKRVMLMGAGGAGSAIAAAVAAQRPASLAIYDVDRGARERLAAR